MLLCKSGFEGEIFKKSGERAKNDAEEKSDAAVFHRADNAEECEEKCGAERRLGHSDDGCASKECNDRADDGDKLIADVYLGKSCGIIYSFCKCFILVICVHFVTSLSVILLSNGIDFILL